MTPTDLTAMSNEELNVAVAKAMSYHPTWLLGQKHLLPHYSTDLSACAPLLDEMAARPVEIELYDLQASVTVRSMGESVFVLGPPSVALPRAIAIAFILYKQEQAV